MFKAQLIIIYGPVLVYDDSSKTWVHIFSVALSKTNPNKAIKRREGPIVDGPESEQS